MTDIVMNDISESTSSFIPNGLLTEASFIPNGLLGRYDGSDVTMDGQGSQAQDDSLPSLSQLLPALSKEVPEPSTNPEEVITGLASARTDTFPRAPIKATTFDGKTVFLSRKKGPPRHRPGCSFESLGDVLETPMYRLMEQLSTESVTQLPRPNDQAIHKPHNSHGTCSDSGLWVDRYRPKRFLDLLGDDRVHRETLSWVKEWDFCVFGKNKPRGKQKKIHVNETHPTYGYEDEYHRPRERILLLSGPPGLGKTTLAHVVAAHAGYQTIEINASDARSAQVVDERIRPALESRGAVGSKKPILLVIDEIDGATGAGDHTTSFVQKLLQLTFDKPKRKARARSPILRPIIAICNDLYASSLAKLRQHARIIRLNRPSDIRLVKRLRDICESENMRTDLRALSTLVGIAHGDMRGCLNTLQFIKSKNQEATEAVIRAATVGMKEADTSMLSVLYDLFSPLSKRRVMELGLTEAQEAKYVGRLSRDVEGSGSLDKLAIGCFEHYLHLHTHDATFQRYEDAHEWLSAFDIFSGTMRSEKEYALMPYLGYPLVAFYGLFAGRGSPRPERPKMDWENFMKTKTNQEIYDSVAKADTPGQSSGAKRVIDYRNITTGDVLKLEFLPFLNRIISPPLRPVNSHLVRTEERALMKRLVDIMVSLELRFVQEKAEDGTLMYRLEPPIDVFVTYDGKRAQDIAVSRYAVRQLVAAEIDAELLSRQADIVEKGQTSRHEFFRRRRRMEEGLEDEPSETRLTRDDAKVVKPKLPQKSKSLEGKVDPVDKPPVDFFGRPINVSGHVNNESEDTTHPELAAKKYKVVYRFKEGNSSAVRKPVKMEAMF